MKKYLAVLLALILAAGLYGCSRDEKPISDLEYVKGKGVLTVAVTDFAPMDYQQDGEWIGFDADTAKAFAQSLGVECKIVEINWDTKINELDSKAVDVCWNGMTLTDEVIKSMAVSRAYCKNGQVIVMKADVASQFPSVENCKDLTFAVESGSAGEKAAQAEGFDYISVTAQADALLEVASGTSDACIIDLLMAGAMIGPGTSYDDLTTTVLLTEEEYGVGFRKGSDLPDVLNQFLADSWADGSLQDRAQAYGLADAIIPQK